jgi:HK97 family phage prohead protease
MSARIERKFVDLRQLKMTDNGPGTIEGYRSVAGVVDEGGDIVVTGAFADSIPEYLSSGFSASSHSWSFEDSIGFPVEAREDDHGFFVKSQFHSTPAAQTSRTIAKERMAAGKTVGFSFGYKADDFQFIEQKDFKDQLPLFIKPDRLEENLKKAQKFSRIRILKKVSVIEDSLVTSPMNKLATATSAKSGSGKSWQQLRHESEMVGLRAKSVLLGVRSMKIFSPDLPLSAERLFEESIAIMRRAKATLAGYPR